MVLPTPPPVADRAPVTVDHITVTLGEVRVVHAMQYGVIARRAGAALLASDPRLHTGLCGWGCPQHAR
jgi:hypothetical protein